MNERVKKCDAELGWHFVGGGPRLAYGHGKARRRVAVRQGLTLHERRPLSICNVGLHSSARPIDALSYCVDKSAPVYVSRVESWGRVERQKDKNCYSYRRHLWIADCTRTLQ